MARVAALVFAALATLILAGGAVIWLLTDECGLICTDRIIVDPVAIMPLVEADLGIRLPPGIRSHALRDGGFQDRFLQARLSATPEGLDALLTALGLGRASLTPDDSPYLGPPGPDWWATEGGGFLTAQVPSPRLAHLSLATRPDPDNPTRWQIFLWGFET